MSDEHALLAAIALHPEEDTPRLMYADWLDEHGQPVRAEFIRVQIEIAQKENLPRAELNPFVDLFKRNQELIDNHRAELLRPIRAMPPDAAVMFRRGFLEEATTSVFHFNQLRETFAALRPLPRVAVSDYVGVIREFLGFKVYLPDLNSAPALVTAVRTAPGEDNTQWFVDRDYALIGSQTWPRLMELDVSGCRLSDRNAAGLLSYSSFPVLTDLDLSGNDLTDAAINSLLASALPAQLKRLILGGNDITDAGAIALANRWPTGDADRLEHLNLRFTLIGPLGQAALLRRFGGRVELF